MLAQSHRPQENPSAGPASLLDLYHARIQNIISKQELEIQDLKNEIERLKAQLEVKEALERKELEF